MFLEDVQIGQLTLVDRKKFSRSEQKTLIGLTRQKVELLLGIPGIELVCDPADCEREIVDEERRKLAPRIKSGEITEAEAFELMRPVVDSKLRSQLGDRPQQHLILMTSDRLPLGGVFLTQLRDLSVDGLGVTLVSGLMTPAFGTPLSSEWFLDYGTLLHGLLMMDLRLRVDPDRRTPQDQRFKLQRWELPLVQLDGSYDHAGLDRMIERLKSLGCVVEEYPALRFSSRIRTIALATSPSSNR